MAPEQKFYRSGYNVIIDPETRDGDALIYNTLSGNLYELEPAYFNLLSSIGPEYVYSPEERKMLDEMLEAGYVTSDPEIEKNRITARLREAAYGIPDSYAAFIVTTFSCNLACLYCFETGIAQENSMSPETADKIIERVKKYAKNRKAVNIVFYGGEPLLSLKLIIHVSTQLKSWCEENGLKWSFGMTTNGTLLTKETVEKLLPLGFKKATVTLDGAKEKHDRNRPFKNGAGSYDTIVANLSEISELIDISVNFIYKDTIDDLKGLLDELKREGLDKKIKAVNPGIEVANTDEMKSGCSTSMQCSPDDARLFCKAVELVNSYGYALPDTLLTGHSCPVAMKYSLEVYSPAGEIYKCVMLLGDRQNAAADIDSEDYYDSFYSGLTKELWHRCIKAGCPYVPLCGAGAGCRVAAFEQNGDLWGEACAKDFYDVLIPQAMRLTRIEEQAKGAAEASED